MKFEWDERKNEANFRRHGLWFEDACYAFADPSALNKFDPEHSADEDRWLLLGSSPINGETYVISHTYRKTDENETVRIISARKVTKKERQTYYQRRRQ